MDSVCDLARGSLMGALPCSFQNRKVVPRSHESTDDRLALHADVKRNDFVSDRQNSDNKKTLANNKMLQKIKLIG